MIYTLSSSFQIAEGIKTSARSNIAAILERSCSVKKGHWVSSILWADIKPATRSRSVRIEENTAAVSASINGDHQLDLCYLTWWKIVKNDLRVKTFEMQIVQELESKLNFW